MPGIINVDFADVRTVIQNAGSALMGIGSASGDKRAIEAATAAINSPLLDISIDGAKGVLFTISGGEDMTMFEVQDAAKVITESIDGEAKVIFGAIYDDKLKKNEIRVTVIASGFPENAKKKSGFFGFDSKSSNEDSAGSNSYEASNQIPIKEKAPEPEKEKPAFRVQPTPVRQPAAVAEKKDDEIPDDDDWSSIPAFLRRPRK